jgi:hypothetical protein
MAANTQVTVTINISGSGVSFNGGSPPVQLIIDGLLVGTITSPASGTSITRVFTVPAISPGNRTYTTSFPKTFVNNVLFLFGTANFSINTVPTASTGTGTLINSPASTNITSQPRTILTACIHGSSLIKMKDGLKRIDQIEAGDEILSGKNLDQYTKVLNVANCWLTLKYIEPNGPDCDAIIFEPGSLGENEPAHRLIIDAGHPMCTKQEYLEKGYQALRPAGSYWEELKGDTIYTKQWTDEFVQEDVSRRYDLVLEEPFNTYIANGVVVRAAGYQSHRYKQFV